MASATKICRVCGKEYEYCHTARKVSGIFRWQDVACSPEHGATYLSKIRDSRNPAETTNYVEPTEVVEDETEELYDVSEDEDDEDSDLYAEDEEEIV